MTMAGPRDPDTFEGLTADELTKLIKSATTTIKGSSSEVQILRKENEELRQRIYDLEHLVGLKKGYR